MPIKKRWEINLSEIIQKILVLDLSKTDRVVNHESNWLKVKFLE